MVFTKLFTVSTVNKIDYLESTTTYRSISFTELDVFVLNDDINDFLKSHPHIKIIALTMSGNHALLLYQDTEPHQDPNG